MDVRTFRNLFVMNDEAYGRQDTNLRSYKTVRRTITDEKIQEHLDGKETIGLYQVKDGLLKWACIDIDIKKEIWDDPKFDFKDWEDRIALQVAEWKTVLEQHGIQSYYEDSGNKGAHVWFFFKEPVAAEPVKEALHTLAAHVRLVDEGLDWELFPKQPNAEFGNLVKGPNGKHQASSKFSNFIDIIHEDTLEYTEFQDIMKVSAAFSAIFDGCDALNQMVEDGLTARHLGHTERLALSYIFANPDLGEAGKTFIKNKVFKHLSDWDERVTNENLDRVAEKDYKPIKCETLQKQGICSARCSKIRNGNSPITFYYRALGRRSEYDQKDMPAPEVNHDMPALNPLDKFYEKDGAYYEIQSQGKKEETHWKLSNFVIRMIEDITIYDDLENQRVFKGLIKLNGEAGKKEFKFKIPAEEWADTNQVNKLIFEETGIGYAQFESVAKIKKCVEKQAPPEPKIQSKVIGYNTVDDELTFLMKSVIVNKHGIWPNNVMPIDFSSERATELQSLDFKMIDEDRFRELTDHIREDYLKLTKNPMIGLSILTTTVLPFVYRYLPVDNKFFVLLKGETGQGKTFMLQAVQRFYCQYDDNETPTFLSWSATANAVQRSSFFYKDVLCLVDDFKRSVVGREMPRALTLLQNYADNTGRGRLRSDMTSQITYYPRGFIVLSGEDKIEGEASTAARGIIIEYPRSAKPNFEAGRHIKDNWHDYAGITPHLIYKLLNMMEETPKLFDDDFYRCVEEYTKKFSGYTNVGRIAQNFAVMATVAKNFVIPWLYHFDPEANVDSLVNRFESFLIDELLPYNFEEVVNESPAALFWSGFTSLLSSQKLKLQNKANELPGQNTDPGIPIGYYGKGKYTDRVYINWGTAYDEVSKHLRAVGGGFSHSRGAVLQDLFHKGIILEEKPAVRNFNRLSQRMITVEKELLEGKKKNNDED